MTRLDKKKFALELQNVESDWRQGNWQVGLPASAWALVQSSPTMRTLNLALKIQHAIEGIDSTSLERIDLQLAKFSNKVQWSKLALRLVCAHLQLDQIDKAHTLVKHYLRGSCGILQANNASRFPLAIAFLLEHYPEKLGRNLRKQATSATSLFKNRGFVNEQLFQNLVLKGCPNSGQSKRLAIVGNGPTLLDAEDGATIDDHDIVIRFNSPNLDKCYWNHTGRRTDICVISPALAKRRQMPGISAIAVSGINLLAGESGYWQRLSEISGSLQVAFFSQEHWYSLVSKLQAPPTAGLLMLASLADTQNLKVSTFGFTKAAAGSVSALGANSHGCSIPAPGTHYGDSQMPSSRHNWYAEAQLLHEWESSRN